MSDSHSEEYQAESNEATNRTKEFTEKYFTSLSSTTSPDGSSFADDLNGVEDEESDGFCFDFDKSQITHLGTNQLLNLALFIRPGLLVENGKGPDDSEMSTTCCQPNICSKRIHTSTDLDLSLARSPGKYEKAPIAAVVYVAENIVSLQNDSPIVPMVFPEGKQGCHEELWNKQQMAVAPKPQNIQAAINILFPSWIELEGVEDVAELSFEILFMAMCQTFDLTTADGWLKLLKRMLNGTDGGDFPSDRIQNMEALRFFTSVVFATTIPLSVALLAGEGAVFSLKQRVMSPNENLLPDGRGHQAVRTSFRLVEGDCGLDGLDLKTYSHVQRSCFSASSESSSIKDFVMDNALRVTEKGSTTTVGGKVNQTTTVGEYKMELVQGVEFALDLVLEIVEHNPQAASVIHSHVTRYLAANGREGEVYGKEYPPREEFLKKMEDSIFNAAPSRKRVPKEVAWIINLLTQFKDPASASAMFFLLCNDIEVSQ